MHIKIIYLLIITSILFSQEDFSDSTYIGLVTKEEMITWESQYKKMSIGIGFGTSNTLNSKLFNSPAVLNGFNNSIYLNNIFFFQLLKQNLSLNVNLKAEYMGYLKPIKLIFFIEKNVLESFYLDIGLGLNKVTFMNIHSELSPVIALKLKTNIPLRIKNGIFSIETSTFYTFTKFDKKSQEEFYMELKNTPIINSNINLIYNYFF